MTNERSVVIVGSGAAGMAAALAAASAGASVTVLEAAEHIGGTTAISGGGIWLAGEGEAERVAALTYLRALGLGDADDALCETYVDAGGDAIAALSARAGLTWQRIGGFSDYHADLPGGSEAGRSLEIAPVRVPADVLARVRPDPHGVPPVTIVEEASPDPPGAAEIAARARDGVCTRGRGLVAACAATLEAAGVDVRTAVRATRLATRDGEVVGVEARGERFGGRVVLASGGFERDPSLVRAFLGGPMLAPAGPPSNRGDGLRMGMAAGAALGNMSEAWWAPAMAVSGATIDGAQLFRMLFMDCAKPGGILIDGRGRRFVDEGANYNDLGRALFAFDAGSYAYPAVPCWLVFDAARRRTAVGPLAPGEPDPDWLVRAASLGELAERVGLPAAAVERSVARFNALAGAGVDEDFGRGGFPWDRVSAGSAALGAVAEPPFYALKVLPGCLGTKGGLRTDDRGRVRHAEHGEVIPGLHAAGNVAANPFGCAYPGPGATVGPALVFGWRAGEAAAADG